MSKKIIITESQLHLISHLFVESYQGDTHLKIKEFLDGNFIPQRIPEIDEMGGKTGKSNYQFVSKHQDPKKTVPQSFDTMKQYLIAKFKQFYPTLKEAEEDMDKTLRAYCGNKITKYGALC